MQIKTTLTQKGSLNLLARTFKNKKEVKKLINFDNFSPLLADAMKKVISDGNVLRTLRPVTKKIRRERGHNVNKPLFATGALHDSIKPIKNGVEFNKYGRFQAQGFTTGSKTMIPNKQVPPRNFTLAIKNKEVASAIQKEVADGMPAMIKKIMRVGVSVKPGG
jgi:hypothetical protein